jgi:hypothetical protein
MGRPSNIGRLPPQIRERVDELLRQSVTLDQIMAKLAELGVEGVSRSGLGRYKQSFDRIGERLKQTREISNALVEKLGDAPEGKQQRLLIEMMRSLVFDVLVSAGEASEGGDDAKDLTLDPEAVMFLARSDLVVRMRRELAAQAEEKLKKLEHEGAAGQARSLDPETLRRVREEIYGITSS